MVPHARSVDDYAEHVATLLAGLFDDAATTVPLDDATGRVTAHPVSSPIDLPIFRNSQMDGYAVDAASVAHPPVTLPVRGLVPAGPHSPAPHVPGTAVKIMTGGAVPDGADAIVPVEDTRPDGENVVIERARRSGEFVRERGSDVHAGTVLLGEGTVLAPRHIAVLAAVGLREVAVRRRPRVAIVTTGDELVPAGTALRPGELFDSNGIALAAAARANGAEVVSLAHSSDRPEEFRARLAEATAAADVVFTSGGISMGDFEVVRETLAPLGAQFGHIAMQPGGPQGSGVVDDTPVLSFPGNPVSTLVSFEVFARPLLRRAAGLPAVTARSRTLREDLHSPDGKRQFLRGRTSGDGVELVSGPGSHLVAAMAWADVLIDVPADATSLTAGTSVTVRPL
ncbi:gephyrin-like molybdotransferase Glp [Rhodococcus sp. HNM0569]|uniref:molybdopterin molybdotransferase MoeA n=1 Tax=Rhodococcus sp. HNM0569 TaxID=2716340 RepID=UPI00146D6CF7|nr:gephyrin-like molybdotransferase Glp [Rhodococcus sp. HNM0569]NLU82012.1 molybdopterin molybdotransferase MoeA [Rhodococcus sp. HNM0569]